MKDELRNKLPDGNEHPGQDKILEYINGDLSGPELQEFEKLLAADPFLQEAAEGLRDLNKESIVSIQAELDLFIKKQLKGRKGRKRKKIEMKWVVIAIVMILLLATVAFIVLKKILNDGA